MTDHTRAWKSYTTPTLLTPMSRLQDQAESSTRAARSAPSQRSDDKSCGEQPSPNQTLMILLFYIFLCRAQRTAGWHASGWVLATSHPRRRWKRCRHDLNMTDSYICYSARDCKVIHKKENIKKDATQPQVDHFTDNNSFRGRPRDEHLYTAKQSMRFREQKNMMAFLVQSPVRCKSKVGNKC